MTTPAEQAVEAAKTAAEIALEAATEQNRIQLEREDAERERKAAFSRASREYAQRLLNESPLPTWFPGAEWGWMDLPLDHSDGQSRYVVRPEKGEEFYLLLTRADSALGGEHLHIVDPDNVAEKPVRVFWAVRGHDRDSGYSYWSASPVEGPADIGQALLAQRERTT